MYCRLKKNKQPEEEVLAQQEDVSDEEEVVTVLCLPVLLLSTVSMSEHCINV